MLLVSDIFPSLFLFDLHTDMGLFFLLADNHEGPGLRTEERGDEENYLSS